jgi:N-acetylgalactosamine-6-sulfatase
VPFILSWPAGGTPQGIVDDVTPLSAVDLLPTFCALAGVQKPASLLDGEDMSAAFRGEQGPRTTPLMWEWRFNIAGHCINRSPMLAIRLDEWKHLLNPGGSRVELYHIPSDPMELDNVADEHPDLVRDLSERVLAWQATLPDGPVDADAGSNAYPWPGRTVG